jgi:transcriptional regulator
MDSSAVNSPEQLAPHIPYAKGGMAHLFDQRRVAPGEKKTYQVKQLWDRQNEILRLSVLGMKQTEIAERLGVTPQTISNTLGSELVQEKMAIMVAERDAATVDLSRQIKELAPKALEIIKDALADNGKLGTKDQVKVAQDVLDRAGYSPVQMVMSANMNIHLTGDDLAEIKRRARLAGTCKDVTPQEVD